MDCAVISRARSRVALCLFCRYPGLLFLSLLTACHGQPSPPASCRSEAQTPAKEAVYAACIVPVGDAILMLQRDRTLALPSGARLPSETSPCAAHRAVWQATGINVEVRAYLGHWRGDTAVFACQEHASLARWPNAVTVYQHQLVKISPFLLQHNQLNEPDLLVPLRGYFNQATQALSQPLSGME